MSGDTSGLNISIYPKQEQHEFENSQTPFFAQSDILQELDLKHNFAFDFNDGLRFLRSDNYNEKLRVKITDYDTDNVCYDALIEQGDEIASDKKYFVKYRIDVYHENAKYPFWSYIFNAEGKTVMLQFGEGGLGDCIAWFACAERFKQKHKCRLVCVMPEYVADIFRDQYPDIRFITKDKMSDFKESIYACYRLGCWFGQNYAMEKVDSRIMPLHKQAESILGLDGDYTKSGNNVFIEQEQPPRVNLTAKRIIEEKYVCIATQASAQCKYWNNPNGWFEVIDFLKEKGYRVLCIDKDKTFGYGTTWNHIPWGTEDFTGDRPLQERIDLIKYADCFIGLGSGLSWLAWCCHTPVVLISGFSHPMSEFFTPYRVINTTACNSCWNDTRFQFDPKSYNWCPRHAENDERRFECSKEITGRQVINTLRKIPAICAAPF